MVLEEERQMIAGLGKVNLLHRYHAQEFHDEMMVWVGQDLEGRSNLGCCYAEQRVGLMENLRNSVVGERAVAADAVVVGGNRRMQAVELKVAVLGSLQEHRRCAVSLLKTVVQVVEQSGNLLEHTVMAMIVQVRVLTALADTLERLLRFAEPRMLVPVSGSWQWQVVESSSWPP